MGTVTMVVMVSCGLFESGIVTVFVAYNGVFVAHAPCGIIKIMTFILFIVVVVFLFVLNGRVGRLESTVKELRAGGVALAQVASVSPSAPNISAQMPAGAGANFTASSLEPAKMPVYEASWSEGFTGWLKEDWLLKLGAFILLLGFGWFVSYAFLNNWIGPLGRVTMGMLAGMGILGFGWVRMHKYPRQGSIFLGLGAMVVLISAYSSAFVYDLLPARGALVIMFLTSAFMALASVRFNVRSLAVLGILIASLAPFTLFANNGSPTYVELFSYLFVVVLSTVWIVAITGWRDLTLAGIVMFLLYSLPHFSGSISESSTLLWFAYGFALLFFVVNTLGILKSKDGNIKYDSMAAALSGLILLTWIMTVAAPEWQSLIIVGWMMLFIVGAFAIFTITKRREPFFVYAGVAIAMLATATAAELDGAALTIAYIIESAVIPMVAYMVMQNRSIAERLTLLMIGPAFLSLSSIFANWRTEIPWDHFFVLFLMAGVSLLLGVFFMFVPRDAEKSNTDEILLVVGSVYGYVLLWLSVHAALSPDYDFATMICLVIYTLIGLGAYAYGRVTEKKGILYYGGTLLGFTIAYLLLVSVWDMALTGKIITFFLIGTLLMMTAFIGRKKK